MIKKVLEPVDIANYFTSVAYRGYTDWRTDVQGVWAYETLTSYTTQEAVAIVNELNGYWQQLEQDNVRLREALAEAYTWVPILESHAEEYAPESTDVARLKSKIDAALKGGE